MKAKVPLYIISIVLAMIGFPTVLIMIYLDMVNSGISSNFFWAASIACCVLSILFFSLGRILSIWAEEDNKQE